MIWPQWASDILDWASLNRIGDISSVLGILISLVGFGVTIWNVLRSKSAAQRAEQAADSVRQTMVFYDSISEISASIALMEEVKRCHREGNWVLLPDRYASLRKLLLSVKSRNEALDQGQLTKLQSAISTLVSLENLIDKAQSEKKPPELIGKNRFVSRDVDALHVILLDLQKKSGEKNVRQ